MADDTKIYSPIDPEAADAADTTLPPFLSTTLPMKTTLLVHLDTERRLSEPKWVKSGDVQEWLKTLFGRMFWVAGDAADGWERRIEVADPDPVRPIQSPLHHFSTNVISLSRLRSGPC
jgi:20S proteasome subunit alpha 6